MKRAHTSRAMVYLLGVMLTVLLLGYDHGTLMGPHAEAVVDKWDLWVGGTHLRGANIHQRRVYRELDGRTFMGLGPVGPPYTQEDFNRLAALGANYVNISHPGLFTERPPYTLDRGVQKNLDDLLNRVAKADMFAVISFRTGPGRSAFTFMFEEVGDWFDASYLNDSIWQDQDAQDAWMEMWRYTAQRYRDHPSVVGYDLMVEPNSNEVGSHALNDLLNIWDPKEFYAQYGGTLYDWNQLYPRITAAIREVDPNTPILIGGMAYSAIEWLPYLQLTGDPRTVYIVHQYAPVVYTHQWWHVLVNTYPGVFDTNWDGVDDRFNRVWLEHLLSTVDTFAARHGVPVAVNEFGVMRWVPGAAKFMDDQMNLFEQRGINHALWVWDPSWRRYARRLHDFNFRLGSNPDNRTDVASSDLMDVIVGYWERNTIRPPLVSVAEISQDERPEQFALEQNYPNPFNVSTTIRYQLPEPGYVNLTISNLLGQKVRVLISEMRPAGYHSVRWDGRNEAGRLVSSGVYLYRMETGAYAVQVRKTLLLR